MRETDDAVTLVAPVVFNIAQLGAGVVEATEVEDTTDETETTEDEEAGTVLTVVEVVDLLVPDTATYAPTIIMSIMMTTIPIIAPLARALCWPYCFRGILIRAITLHKSNRGISMTNIYFENRIWSIYMAIETV